MVVVQLVQVRDLIGTLYTCNVVPYTAVSCGSLSDPTNGGVMTTGTTLSSTATYTCNPGYTRSGDQTRTCQANRNWSGSEPSCNREYDHQYQIQIYFCRLAVNCSSLDAPTNGAVDTSSGTTFNQVATYSCIPGYMISGATTRTCQASGSWSPAPPTCPRESH